MRKDYERLFACLKSPEPPAGLFDRIISAIKREEELRQTKRLLFRFLSLLAVSLVAVSFSGVMLANQIKTLGIFYFISMAISDLDVFFAFWQDFVLAILESLPIEGIASFFLGLALFVFTLRLFLRRKRLLLNYLINR